MHSSEDASVLVWAEGLFSCLWLCLAGILESSIIDCPSELFHTARLKLNRPQLSPLERICAEMRTAVVVIERWGWQTNSFQHLVWRESANLYLDLEKWMKPVFFWWVEKVHWRDWYIHAHSTDMFLGLISRQNIVLKKKKKKDVYGRALVSGEAWPSARSVGWNKKDTLLGIRAPLKFWNKALCFSSVQCFAQTTIISY